jgi:hypothetical protein
MLISAMLIIADSHHKAAYTLVLQRSDTDRHYPNNTDQLIFTYSK